MNRISSSAPLLLLAMLFVVPAAAEAGTHPGLRLGFNTSTMVGDDVSGAERRPGFTGGLGIVQTLVGPLGISLEVLYTQRGVHRGEWTEWGDQFSRTPDTRLSYLETPLFLRFDVPAVPFITPHIEFGGYFGYLLSGTIEGPPRVVARFIEDRIQPVDAGLHIGVGTSYEVGPVQLQLTMRYQMGLVETVKNLNVDNTFDFQPDIFNRSLTFMLGAGF